MIGKVHATMPLRLHRRIGEAKNESTTLEVLQVEPTGEPMIVHQDGRTFTLSWEDILKLAQDAFAEDLESAKVAP